MTAVLETSGLRLEYAATGGPAFVAVRDLALSIGPGEIHAPVGESGAGKTAVGNAPMGLPEPPGRIAAGRVVVAGREVDAASGRAEGIVQGRDIGAIFQDPMTSLTPLFTIQSQLS